MVADLEENYDVTLTLDQYAKVNDAREQLMNAADSLHSVAAELVGDLKVKED